MSVATNETISSICMPKTFDNHHSSLSLISIGISAINRHAQTHGSSKKNPL
jgi:hypothetical protein